MQKKKNIRDAFRTTVVIIYEYDSRNVYMNRKYITDRATKLRLMHGWINP